MLWRKFAITDSKFWFVRWPCTRAFGVLSWGRRFYLRVLSGAMVKRSKHLYRYWSCPALMSCAVCSSSNSDLSIAKTLIAFVRIAWCILIFTSGYIPAIDVETCRICTKMTARSLPRTESSALLSCKKNHNDGRHRCSPLHHFMPHEVPFSLLWTLTGSDNSNANMAFAPNHLAICSGFRKTNELSAPQNNISPHCHLSMTSPRDVIT